MIARLCLDRRDRARRSDRVRSLGAQHQGDDALFTAVRALGHADRDAIAQHRRAVAQSRDLGHAVGDEDDRGAPPPPAPHHRIDPLGQVRRQRRSDLVEQQHRGLRGERPGQIDQAQRRIGQVAHERAEIDPRDAELLQPFPHLLEGDAGEAHVLADSQVRHERGVLVNGDDPRGARLSRRAERSGDPLHRNLPAVRPEHTGDDLHQRALAGPVRPHQPVDLARAHLKRSGLQRDDRVEPLGDIPRLEE